MEQNTSNNQESNRLFAEALGLQDEFRPATIFTGRNLLDDIIDRQQVYNASNRLLEGLMVNGIITPRDYAEQMGFNTEDAPRPIPEQLQTRIRSHADPVGPRGDRGIITPDLPHAAIRFDHELVNGDKIYQAHTELLGKNYWAIIRTTDETEVDIRTSPIPYHRYHSRWSCPVCRRQSHEIHSHETPTPDSILCDRCKDRLANRYATHQQDHAMDAMRFGANLFNRPEPPEQIPFRPLPDYPADIITHEVDSEEHARELAYRLGVSYKGPKSKKEKQDNIIIRSKKKKELKTLWE